VGYETLAGTLQTTDAIYGLRSVGLDGDAPPLERVEEIATRFVAEVRRVHPAGPYRLLGLCVGGMVAYEMAQQLQAEGASVELVGLIDTWPASLVAGVKRRFAIVTRIADLTARTIRVLTNVWKAPAGTRLAYLRSKNAAARAMVVQRDVFRGDARERGRALVMEANQRAASRYRPKPYPGTGFLVITTGRNLPAYRDPRLIWQRLLRDAAPVLRVPGPDSGALLRPPFVSGLADALHQRLDSNGNGTSHP
jgi:thioesterase domain-containing protein